MAETKRLQVDIDAFLFDRLKRDAREKGFHLWAYVQNVLRAGIEAKANENEVRSLRKTSQADTTLHEVRAFARKLH